MNNNRPRDRNGFEIAIICALPLERDAVEALLDEEYETDGHSYDKAAGDKNVYTTGRLGKQHVVIAHMPGMGAISAAIVAVNLLSSFQKIKVAFVVGVCGGVPNPSSEIEIVLGDVIISTSVVQIDFGRQYPNGFERKKEVEDILGRADLEIRAFVGKLSGYRSRTRLREKTQSLLTQLAAVEGFSSAAYPGSEHDVLYDAEYRHKHRGASCNICDSCESNQDEVCETASKTDCSKLGCQGFTLAIRRPGSAVSDALLAHKPSVHFGRIACGNQVIKSGVHRDEIATMEGVIAFEMESAGTWDYVPTIVVKSVCDYADSHKNKKWQSHAAAAAAACTKAILEEWRSTDRTDLPAQPSFPVHWTVTRCCNTLFTGRQDVLSDLMRIVRTAIEDKSQRAPCHIVISGMGGQGKSEICLQLASQVRSLFWGIFWVDVSTESLAENGFLDIANRISGKTSTWEVARQALANNKHPWLLVLDNADDPNTDYQRYFPTSTFGVVIMTSRTAECERYATKGSICLTALAQADACKLLLQAANVPATRHKSLMEDVQAVARLLQSHPLAIIQAGSYISRGHCSLKEYPQEYDRQRKRLLAFRPSQARSRYQDVYATFEASAETLRNSGTDAATDALQLLSVLAVYAPTRLPVALFEYAWKGAKKLLTTDVPDTDLHTMSSWHLARLPPILQVGLTEWNPFRLVEALNLLKAFSLISVDGEEALEWISMHPLVHAWARDRLEPEEQHACWVQAGCIIALVSDRRNVWFTPLRQIQSHLQFATSWPFNTMFLADHSVEICRILIPCGELMYELEDDQHLQKLLDSLFDHLDVDRFQVDPQWVDCYRLAARALVTSGLGREALFILEQIHRIRVDTLPAHHPDILSSEYELAMAYRDNGQLENALMLIKRVVMIEEQTLPEDYPHRLTSEQELALAYRENGQLEDALVLLKRIVRIREQILPEEHPHRLSSEHELAMAYRENGQSEDALVLIKQVVRIQEQTLPEEHNDRLASEHELAMAYKENGQLEDALVLIKQVVRIQEQTLPEDHGNRLFSEHTLALCLWETGEERAAVDLMQKVVNIRRHSLNESHPHLIASISWLEHFEKTMKQGQRS